VGSTLDGSPVLAKGDGHCIDAVHDPFVVSRSSVLVKLSEPMGFKDLGGNFVALHSLPGQFVDGDLKASSSKSLCAKVGEDPDSNLALAEDLADIRRDCLHDGVDCVGPHGLPDVDEQLDHDHVVRKASVTEVDDSASSGDHGLEVAVCKLNDCLLVLCE